MAKKKIDTPKARTKAAKSAAKTKKTGTPKSTVKVVEGDSLKKLRKNVDSYYSTVKAKSGVTAKEKASEIVRENKKSKTPKVTVKIRGGAGLGGMFNTKNR